MFSPSTAAASSSSVGRLSKNAFITSRLKTLMALGSTIAQIGVPQAEAADQHVVGDQAAGEEHGEHGDRRPATLRPLRCFLDST